jgi:hypothetical protein
MPAPGVTTQRLLAALLLTIAATAAPAQEQKPCGFCSGIVVSAAAEPGGAGPVLLVPGEGLEAAAGAIASLPEEARGRTTLRIDLTLPAAGAAALDEAERTISRTVSFLSGLRGLRAVAIAAGAADPAVEAFAIKRLTVSLEGAEVTGDFLVVSSGGGHLDSLRENGANAYFDGVLTSGADVGEVAAWLAANDPAKYVEAVTVPSGANAFHDAALLFAAGARRVYFESAAEPRFVAALVAINEEMTGDYAVDPSADAAILAADGSPLGERTVAFIRGEDLQTVIAVPGTREGARILALSDADYTAPRIVGAEGSREITDRGRRGDRFLIGLQPSELPFAVAVARPPLDPDLVTRETIDVATRREVTVEEIVRRHQAYWSHQASITPRYVARNETKLRFAISQAGEAIEATIAGDHFIGGGISDWIWSDFFINGVRWRYGRIPELPLVQPEKVTQLPLDLHFTNDYRYSLAGETRVGGYDVWEVRFEPPRNAPADLPLYRGTVWIDKATAARVSLAMVQLNLSGEILSNEERITFEPFSLAERRSLTAAEALAAPPRGLVWLPLRVDGQQVLSTAGRSTVVLRETRFSGVDLGPDDFDVRLSAANASNSRMVRDTDAGLRYLERTADGERVVKSGFETGRLFLVGGVHHDGGLDFPVMPLGGVNYFDFNLGGRGIQTNVFFAGAILAATISDPSIAGTRANATADFFGIAIPMSNTMHRGGSKVEEETVKALPLTLALRAGHPLLGFGKVDVSLGLSHISYQRSEETASDFVIPENTFVFTPTIELRYDRFGYSLSGFFERGMRSGWEPWGLADEFDEAQESFDRFGATLGKSFFLPKFQRIGVQLNYLDGADLDRFSKYELGFFGSPRVRGIESGSVRAEKALLGHLSYGFVFSEQFRVELFYDHALLDDAISGYRREPFQGVGLSGQTVGPWGTLLRFDIGRSVGRNAQDGFVGNVLFLKLFGG